MIAELFWGAIMFLLFLIISKPQEKRKLPKGMMSAPPCDQALLRKDLND